MPMHDWMKIDAGIFHAFHHEWISEIHRALNRGLLPPDYYALPEQVAGGFGPAVVTLQTGGPDEAGSVVATAPHVLQPRPTTRITSQTQSEFYRRKKSAIAVRHVSGDRVVAIIEIISPGNKESRHSIQAFVNKACEFLGNGIHLLIVDPFPPGKRDPNGIHGLIWEVVEDADFRPPPERPLTLVAYESDLITRAYVESIAIGDPLPDMPVFLEPDGCIMLPLDETYRTAFEVMPRRWRDELERQIVK